MMAKLFWYAQAGLKRLGWLGVAGLGLLAFCLAFYVSALLPAQARLSELQAQADSLRVRQSHASQTQEVRPEAQLAAFYGLFPNAAATPDLLEKLFNAAQESGVALDQGEYRLVSGKDERIARYQVTLPVQGSYPQIRKFIGHVLAELPAASLDGVSFQRQKVGDTVVESQIKMTLYLGSKH
jgi:Tfp pilus assembly protein PilO